MSDRRDKRRTRSGSVFAAAVALFGSGTPSHQLPNTVTLKTPEQRGTGYPPSGTGSGGDSASRTTVSPLRRTRNSNAVSGGTTPVTPLQLLKLNYTADLPLHSLEEEYVRALDFISRHPKAFTSLQLSSLQGWLELAKQNEEVKTPASATPDVHVSGGGATPKTPLPPQPPKDPANISSGKLTSLAAKSLLLLELTKIEPDWAAWQTPRPTSPTPGSPGGSSSKKGDFVSPEGLICELHGKPFNVFLLRGLRDGLNYNSAAWLRLFVSLQGVPLVTKIFLCAIKSLEGKVYSENGDHGRQETDLSFSPGFDFHAKTLGSVREEDILRFNPSNDRCNTEAWHEVMNCTRGLTNNHVCMDGLIADQDR